MSLIEALSLLLLVVSAVAGSVLIGSEFGFVGYVLGPLVGASAGYIAFRILRLIEQVLGTGLPHMPRCSSPSCSTKSQLGTRARIPRQPLCVRPLLCPCPQERVLADGALRSPPERRCRAVRAMAADARMERSRTVPRMAQTVAGPSGGGLTRVAADKARIACCKVSDTPDPLA